MSEHAIEQIVGALTSQYGILGIVLLIFTFAMLYMGKYYTKTFLPQQREDRKEDQKLNFDAAEKRDAMMQRSIESQERTSGDIRDIVKQQSIMQKEMCNTLRSLTELAQRTSQTLATHDEKCNSIVSALNNHSLTVTNSVERLNTAINEQSKINASVEEKVSNVENRIDDLTESVNKTFLAVNEIKFSLPTICKSK